MFMRVAILFVLLSGVLAVLPPVAGAQDDVDCASFPSRAAAQAQLEADPSDPSNLDADGDGRACNSEADDAATGPRTTPEGAGDADAPADGNRANRPNRRDGGVADSGQPAPAGVRCADFGTQAEAEAALAADPSLAGRLDQNGDGVACKKFFGAEDPAAEAPATPEPTPAPAAATIALPDVDCIDLAYQGVAQTLLERDPTDPFNLDPSGDGVACNSLPRQGVGGAVVALPSTGGWAAPTRGSVPSLAALLALGVIAVAGAAVRSLGR